MAGRILELHQGNTPHAKAMTIAHTWDDWYYNKSQWQAEHEELNKYITATDTTSTQNKSLEWMNTTTTPKLTQIRDNLHSNYVSALFPNNDWLRWEAYSPDSATFEKKQAIEGYIANKTRREGFRTTMSQLLLDYIDFGNAFAYTDYVHKTMTDENEEQTVIYSGPVLKRIHPHDIVMNPTASKFEDTPIIVRSIQSMGELKLEAMESLNASERLAALKQAEDLRGSLGTIKTEDSRKYISYQVDGFGNYLDYLGSGYVEILTFMGTFYDVKTGEVQKNRKIQIIDRSFVLSDEEIPDWIGRNVHHVGWRLRSDNLWAMGPLDNLVGMQYRIDHLENLKADAMDMHVLPPLLITGNVDAFEWGPREEIHADENGSVTPMRPDSSAIQVNFEIASIMDKMELMAGAPREAMGVRTPGEKTAFEVQQLSNAAGRIFQEKITAFEIGIVEPSLNSMLEQGRRNLSTVDVVSTTDSTTGAAIFMNLTKQDIAGDGILRPVGARHFGEQAIMIQNLQGMMNGVLGEVLRPHTSGVNLAKLVEDSLGLERFSIFRPNIGVIEATETQSMAAQGQKTIVDESTVPTE